MCHISLFARTSFANQPIPKFNASTGVISNRTRHFLMVDKLSCTCCTIHILQDKRKVKSNFLKEE